MTWQIFGLAGLAVLCVGALGYHIVDKMFDYIVSRYEFKIEPIAAWERKEKKR